METNLDSWIRKVNKCSKALVIAKKSLIEAKECIMNVCEMDSFIDPCTDTSDMYIKKKKRKVTVSKVKQLDDKSGIELTLDIGGEF